MKWFDYKGILFVSRDSIYIDGEWHYKIPVGESVWKMIILFNLPATEWHVNPTAGMHLNMYSTKDSFYSFSMFHWKSLIEILDLIKSTKSNTKEDVTQITKQTSAWYMYIYKRGMCWNINKLRSSAAIYNSALNQAEMGLFFMCSAWYSLCCG